MKNQKSMFSDLNMKRLQVEAAVAFTETKEFKRFAKMKSYQRFMKDYEAFCAKYLQSKIMHYLNGYLNAKSYVGKKIKKPDTKWN
jgi:hypothetical protein